MTTPPEITAVILAGGKSRRFGSDKLLHRQSGQFLVERVRNAVAQVAERVLVSVAEPRDDLPLSDEQVVDRFAGAGPLAGLHAAMEEATTPAVLAVAGDLPYLTGDVLRLLVVQHESSGANAAVVAETPDGRLQPLCAIYPRSMRTFIQERLETQRRSMLEMLRAWPEVVPVPVPEDPLRNVNTPRDLGRSAR